MKHPHILLIGINAKYIHSNPAIYSLKAYADAYYPSSPEGGTISSPESGTISSPESGTIVRPANCRLSLAEYTVNQSVEFILADLYRRNPDVLAVSCYIWNWTVVRALLAELPKLLPDTALWLGGPEVSFRSEKIIDAYPQLTGIMVGEGEETFLALLKHYWTGRPALSSISGIVLKEGFTGERALTDLNRIPFPYPAPGSFGSRILYYESQRGCPFSCAYCLSSIDKSVRLRSLETVYQELQAFLDSRVPQVKFIDRTFNCNAAHALAIWRFLRNNDNGVTNFHFEIAADLLTEEQLDVMKDMRPGLIQLEIGVQSTNKTALRAVNRRTDLSRLKKAVARINGYNNIHQHLDLIAGLPFEDYDSFARSFDDVYFMAPNQLQLGFLKVLKGSPIEAQADEYGIVYSENPPYEVLYTRWLRYDELLLLKGIEEMVSVYYNSSQFVHTLPVLLTAYNSPFRMFEALADYCRQNGYETCTPSRSRRYQILLDFACTVLPDRRRLFAELLTFDLYLRENLKSRPAFAPENGIGRKQHRQLLEKEGLPGTAHAERFSYPVWERDAARRCIPLDVPACVLFDYEKRDALTYNAQITIVFAP